MKKLIALLLMAVLLCSVALAETSAVSVGDLVTFGHYEQDNNLDNGPEPLEWIVLDIQDGKAFVLSKYGLEAKPYNAERTDVTWETCSLRSWLNDDFLNAAFTPEEQAVILLTDVDNSADQGYGEYSTDGGNNTQDKIFLLSYGEANRYFEVHESTMLNMKSRVAPTQYAIATGAWSEDSYKTNYGEAAWWWWLRSPGSSQDEAAFVPIAGSFGGLYVSNDSGVARPALWLNLESETF